MDSTAAERIIGFLENRVAVSVNPRNLGTALQGRKYQGMLRYRVGDYRILAEIKDSTVTVLVVDIGHRREVYR